MDTQDQGDTEMKGDNEMVAAVVIAEAYFPERVLLMVVESGLRGGSGTDTTTYARFGRPWDFSKASMRRRAYKRILEEEPLVLIGSVVCRDCRSMMQTHSPRVIPHEHTRRLREAGMHLQFVCSLYGLHRKRGKLQVHAHLRAATSWK